MWIFLIFAQTFLKSSAADLLYVRKGLITLSINSYFCIYSAHPKLDYDNRLKGVQNIKAGTTLSLPVNTSGIPSPSVAWMLDEEPMEKSPRITIDTAETLTTLTVKNTTLDDSGVYTVEAENTVGKAVADFQVNVRGQIFSFIYSDFNICDSKESLRSNPQFNN